MVAHAFNSGTRDIEGGKYPEPTPLLEEKNVELLQAPIPHSCSSCYNYVLIFLYSVTF